MPANSENLIAPLLKLASYVHSASSGIVIAPTPANEQTIDVPTPTNTNKAPIRDPLIDKLKEHIVQIEAMLAYIILFMGACVLINAVVEPADSKKILKLLSVAFLAGVGAVVRVTNPSSTVRNRITSASVFGAVGAVLGGVLDALAHGFTAGQGMIWGGAGGAAIGTALGEWYHTDRSRPIERAVAFAYLYEKRHACRWLANPTLVQEALTSHIGSQDINEDGRKWYSYDDLDTFIKNGPRTPPAK